MSLGPANVERPARRAGPGMGQVPVGACEAACCIAPANIPWFGLAVGIFVTAQTMLFGTSLNITAPEDPATGAWLNLAMLGLTGVVAGMLGVPLAVQSVRELGRRRVTMELLFVAGIGAALAISVHSVVRGRGPVYFDVANLLLVIYSIGRAITAGSRGRALEALVALKRPLARARRAGSGEMVEVESIVVGDRVSVYPGELVPIDGRVVEGTSLVRSTAFTGEFLSAMLGPGGAVLAGAAAEDGTLVVEASAAGNARRIDALAQLIEVASGTPPAIQRTADRFVRVLLPVVFGLCGATAMYWWWRGDVGAAVMNPLAMLLVACPCAAGLAAPLAQWSAIGALARRGLFVRSGDAIERLAEVDCVVFDKTGTLSEEAYALHSIATDEDPGERGRTLAMIAAVEGQSTHPVARALRGVADGGAGGYAVEVARVRILAGRGIEAQVSVDGGAAGLLRIVREEGGTGPYLRLRVTLDGVWRASVALSERLRDSAQDAVGELKAMGLGVEILTGDRTGVATAHLAEARVGMTPEQKHEALVESVGRGRRALFVGDGVNDAAAMAAAHAGVALASGAAITTQTACAVLHTNDLTQIPKAIALCGRVVRTMRANLYWAIAYNAVGIVAAASGHLHPILAAVLMSVSSAVVAWRSLRAGEAGTLGSDRDAVAPAEAAERGGANGRRAKVVGAVHYGATVAQVIVLAQIAGLGLPGALGLLVASVVGLRLVMRRELTPTWDMMLAMLTIGGLGMVLGWGVDTGFVPATAARHACCAAGGPGLWNWMNGGMLVLGVPAMYLGRFRRQAFSWRQWCCVGPLVLGIPMMVGGMWLGSLAAMRLSSGWASLDAGVHYGLMMVGMGVGMLMPHALEYFAPRLAGPGKVGAAGGL